MKNISIIKYLTRLVVLLGFGLGAPFCDAKSQSEVLFPSATDLFFWKLYVSHDAGNQVSTAIGCAIGSKQLALKQSIRTYLGLTPDRMNSILLNYLRKPAVLVGILGIATVGGVLALYIIRYMRNKAKLLNEKLNGLNKSLYAGLIDLED